MEIPASRVAAIEAAQAVQADVKVFSDGLGIDGNIGAATVLYKNGEVKSILRKQLGSADRHTVFEAEVVCLSLAAELVIAESNVPMAVIRSDSQVAIRETRSMEGMPG